MKATVSGVVEDHWSFPDSAQLADSAKLRQPTGQTQDNFNFGPSLLKGVFSKPSGDYIVAPIFCLLS